MSNDRSLKLEVLLQAIDKASAPLKAIAGNSGGMARAVKDARDRMRDLETQNKRIDHFRKVAKDVGVTGAAMKAAQAQVKDLAQQMAATDQPSKTLVKAFEAARREAGQLGDRHAKLTEQQHRLRGELQAAGVPLQGMARHQAELRQKIDAANASFERQQTALKRLAEADVAGKFRNMTGEVGRLARRTAMLGGAAAGGIFALANSTATLGDNVAKTADTVGISIAGLQELRYAAERTGVSTSDLDSSMERFVRRIGQASLGTGAAKKAYEDLGLSAEALARMTPEKSLGIVADRLRAVQTHSERAALANAMFGNSGAAMLNMLRNGTPGLEELRRQAQLTGYVLSDEAARGAEDFKDAMLDAQLGMAGVKNTIGAELMPAITGLMHSLSGWLRENRHLVQAWAQAFGERLKQAVPVIIETAKGIAAITQRVAAAVSWVARLVGGFDNLAMIMAVLFASKAIFSVIAFGIAVFKAGGALLALSTTALPAVIAGLKVLAGVLIANPIGAAIAAIALGALLIYRYWDPIKAFFGRLWDGIKTTIDGGIGAIGAAILNWSPLGLLYKAFAGVLGWLGVELPSQLSEAGSKMLGGLIDGVTAAVGAAKAALDGVWSDIRSAFDAGLSGVGALILNWSPLGLFHQVFAGVLSWFGVELPGKFTDFGSMMITGLVNGITGSLGRARDAISGAGESVVGWFKDKLGINSPSKVFADLGGFTMQGLAQGLDKHGDGAIDVVLKTARQLTAAGAAALTLSAPAYADTPAVPMPPVIEQAIRYRAGELPDGPQLARLAHRVGYQTDQAPALPALPAALQQIRYQVADAPTAPSMPAIEQALRYQAQALPVAPVDAGAVRVDNRRPLAAPSFAHASAAAAPAPINITINAAPGMDAQAVARAVSAEIERQQRARAARSRTRLADLE